MSSGSQAMKHWFIGTTPKLGNRPIFTLQQTLITPKVSQMIGHGNCPAQSSLPVLEFLATGMYVVRNFPCNSSLIHKLKKALMSRRFKDVTIQEQLQAAPYCFKLTKKATPSIMANIFWAKNVLMQEMECMFESMWHICVLILPSDEHIHIEEGTCISHANIIHMPSSFRNGSV